MIIKWLFLALYGAIVQEAPSCAKVMQAVQTSLPHEGILKSGEGFVYVDVDNAYIHQLVPLIAGDGFEAPPYFQEPFTVGAHITVIYPEEMAEYGISEMEEVGEGISFIPLTCQVVQPAKLDVDEVYFVTVLAPQLDALREKYGLPKRKYDFHITIGVALKKDKLV